MDMIVETLPYIMNYSILQILINHTPYFKKPLIEGFSFENKGMPPPADFLLAQIGELPSSFQPFYLLQPPVSVPTVSTIFYEEIAHRKFLPL
jgi:hypothetical protein